MGLFSWWQQGEQEPASADLRTRRPGEKGVSIYEHVAAHAAADAPGLLPGGERLPDEAVAARRAAVAAGREEPSVEPLVVLLRTYCQAPSGENLRAVYEHVVRHPVLKQAGELFDALLAAERPPADRLHALAHTFATEGGDREPVKLGILLLGLFRRSDDLPILRTLGRHDEFTRYAATALTNCVPNGEEEVWALAQEVRGWGRIHLVKRLLASKNPRIRNWLLREGFRNTVKAEQLALQCAAAGGLRETLSAEQVDEALLTSVGELLLALLGRDRAKAAIDQYRHAVEAVERYLVHLESHPPSVSHFLAVSAILAFATDSSGPSAARAKRGWTQPRRDAIEARCRAYLKRPEWPAVIRTALAAKDDAALSAAERVAAMLRLTTWETHWKHLCEAAESPVRWRAVIAQCPDGHLTQVVAVAESRLPLKDLAREAEATDALARHQACLAAVLKAVARTPGLGHELLKVGLRCPLDEARAAAAEALHRWGPEFFPQELRHTVGFAASVEPVPSIRKAMKALLAVEKGRANPAERGGKPH